MSELAQPFSMSLPAIMKHLDVLSDAGLIARDKTGRIVACRLTAKPMEQAMEWLNRYQRFWSDNLDRLAAFVEEDTWPPNQTLPRDAGLTSRPSLTLKRRLNAPPEKVYAAWTDPQKIAALVRARRRSRPARCRRISICASAAVTASASTAEDGEYHEVGGIYREVVPNAAARVQLGVAFDAGTRIAGHGRRCSRTAAARC